jgi:hypothetical protein
LNHSFGFAILSDDHGLAAFREVLQHLGSVGLEVANGFDLRSGEHDVVRL